MTLDLVIGLPLRNREAFANLLQQQYTPSSPEYHRWLKPEQFAGRFGPTEQDYQAVVEFVKANGFTVTGTHSNRTLLDVRASVADIERVFHVSMHLYQHPTENRQFYAPDTEPSLDLTVPIFHITGLDNYIVPHRLSAPVPAQRKAANATPASGSGPSGNYMGYDFRAAYVPGVSLTGTGQAVGLFQLDGYYANDITSYESQAGLPDVPLVNVAVDGGVSIPGDGDDEVSLDIEMAISMAPGLSKVIVYEAPFGSNANDILNKMATDDLASQLSASWTYPIDATTEQIYQQFAAQGQSFFQASGDNGAYTDLWPDQQQMDSSNVTLVGGTTLATTGAGGSWVAETVWNDNVGTGYGETNDASGGGISTTCTIPSWQQEVSMSLNGGSTLMRNVPDVAMVADNIWVIHGNGRSGAYVGTSCATPLWAGFMALVNQQASMNGQPSAGLINPAIYAVGKGTAYASCFHDITVGNNKTYYSPFQFLAAPGYDLCTGWGTPAGSNLVNALAPTPESDLTRDTDSLDNMSPPAGTTVTVSITITNEACSSGSAVAGTFHVGFYWSTDSSFAGVSPFRETPVNGCPDGGSVSITQPVTIPAATTPRTYYLGYNIDDSNEVAECTETDKGVFYWTVTVQPESGSKHYVFTSPPLWDVSGSYTNVDTTSGTDTVIETIQQQASGLITGTRTETYVNGSDSVEGSGPIAGKTVPSPGMVRASLKENESLSGVRGGIAYSATASIRETAAFIPPTLYVSGSARLCPVGGKCSAGTESFTVPLSADVSGGWTLTINPILSANTISGSGTVTLSNGRQLEYQITGTYSPKTQLSKLKLVGLGDAVGTSFSLTTEGTDMTLLNLKGKVLGQKPTYP